MEAHATPAIEERSEAPPASCRRAGFQRVRAWQENLSRQWTPAAYLEYVEACRNADAFASLDADARTALRDRIGARLANVPSAGFDWSAPIVFATGGDPADDLPSGREYAAHPRRHIR